MAAAQPRILVRPAGSFLQGSFARKTMRTNGWAGRLIATERLTRFGLAVEIVAVLPMVADVAKSRPSVGLGLAP